LGNLVRCQRGGYVLISPPATACQQNACHKYLPLPFSGDAPNFVEVSEAGVVVGDAMRHLATSICRGCQGDPGAVSYVMNADSQLWVRQSRMPARVSTRAPRSTKPAVGKRARPMCSLVGHWHTPLHECPCRAGR